MLDANLFAFTVTEYSDYFEMEISESPRVNVFYQGAVLFHKGQVYFLTDQQMRLLKKLKRYLWVNKERNTCNLIAVIETNWPPV